MQRGKKNNQITNLEEEKNVTTVLTFHQRNVLSPPEKQEET